MTFNNFLPPKTYAFLVQIQQQYKLSLKEVERIFVNKVASDLGFQCHHERIGFAKSDKQPYCKDCWTRLRKTVREPYRIENKLITNDIQYLEKETFLDEFYKDKKEIAKKDGSVADNHNALEGNNNNPSLKKITDII